MNRLDFTLILPCYNEGPSFNKSVDKIVKSLNGFKFKYEIIFVEDKSLDETRETVQRLVKEYKNTRLILHSKNMGRGKSVSDGIIASRANICGYVDVDCEISPSYIPLFVREVLNGHDLVVGKRFYESGFNNITRVLSSKVYAFAVRSLIQLPIDDTEAGYKFFNRKNILPLLGKVKNKHWFWDTEICIRVQNAKLKCSQVPVIFRRRQEKKSTVRLIPDTYDYLKNLIRIKKDLAVS